MTAVNTSTGTSRSIEAQPFVVGPRRQRHRAIGLTRRQIACHDDGFGVGRHSGWDAQQPVGHGQPAAPARGPRTSRRSRGNVATCRKHQAAQPNSRGGCFRGRSAAASRRATAARCPATPARRHARALRMCDGPHRRRRQSALHRDDVVGGDLHHLTAFGAHAQRRADREQVADHIGQRRHRSGRQPVAQARPGRRRAGHRR